MANFSMTKLMKQLKKWPLMCSSVQTKQGRASEAINHIIFLIRNESFAIHLESACLEQSRKHLPMSIPEVAFVLFDPSLHLFPTEKLENSKRKGAKPLLFFEFLALN